MNNFIFENKTKVYFGKGGVKEYLGSLLGNYGETVMLAYGGGSIKRNGVYDEIMGILNAAGKRIVEDVYKRQDQSFRRIPRREAIRP